MTESQDLLDEFVRNRSEGAFRELVSRYVDLVYSTALRLVDGNAHQAQDVAQEVFVDLARKAVSFPEGVQLGGWLHRHTCFVASHWMRGERRRQFRERQAVEMNALNEDSGLDFGQVAAVLDEAVNELEEADRTAVVLRFYEQRDFRAVGEVIGSNEDAARMRVNRALEKLEGGLRRRGITTTGAALSAALTAHAVQSAPVGLAAAISAVALGGTLVSTGTAIATTKVIGMTTLQKALIAATVAVVAGAGVYEVQQGAKLRKQAREVELRQGRLAVDEAASGALKEEVERLRARNGELTEALAKANGDKERLATEREQAKRSAAIYKELAEQASSRDGSATNAYPTPRHLWTALGKFARLAAMSKEDDSKLSAEEKAALNEEKLGALGELPRLIKALKQYDEAQGPGHEESMEERMDLMACLFYGALNLDEGQFSQVYGLMQGLQDEAQQKGLSWTNAAPDNVRELNEMIDQFKGDMPRLLTADQAKIFTGIVPLLHFNPGTSNNFSFNFNY
jgi:RNA polymerase sigma factor (sigma-70 family)